MNNFQKQCSSYSIIMLWKERSGRIYRKNKCDAAHHTYLGSSLPPTEKNGLILNRTISEPIYIINANKSHLTIFKG